jgi:hypothetical protein
MHADPRVRASLIAMATDCDLRAEHWKNASPPSSNVPIRRDGTIKAWLVFFETPRSKMSDHRQAEFAEKTKG